MVLEKYFPAQVRADRPQTPDISTHRVRRFFLLENGEKAHASEEQPGHEESFHLLCVLADMLRASSGSPIRLPHRLPARLLMKDSPRRATAASTWRARHSLYAQPLRSAAGSSFL